MATPRKTLAEYAREAQGLKGLCCPSCGCRDFRVRRTTLAPDKVQRIRLCRQCGRKVITAERIIGQPETPEYEELSNGNGHYEGE